MKPLLFLLLLTSASAAVDNPVRLRAAIREVEGVTDPALVGASGELGFYRLTPAVWYRWTDLPFAYCGTNHALEERIALRHINWLVERLIANKRLASPYTVAVAWNGGVRGFLRGGNARSRSFGDRVRNLYIDVAH